MSSRGETATARSEPVSAPAAPPLVASAPPAAPRVAVQDFLGIVALARENREARLVYVLENLVHLVRFERGRLELRLAPGANASFPGELSDKLAKWTGERWVVTVSSAEGEATIAQQRDAAETARRASAAQDPLLKAAMAVFPGARIVAVRDRDEFAPEADSESGEAS
jgi:DNA polymerase-3 subunit gamma/tau